jgi:hypothetical protein
MKNSPVTVLQLPTQLDPEKVDPDDPATVRVRAWIDSRTNEMCVHPRSLYVENFWLPVLGPSTTWLYRHLVDELEVSPLGVELDLDDVARSLGLGGARGRHSAFGRSIVRLIHYGLAQRSEAGELAVRGAIGPVPRRHLIRLPASVQERHRAWGSGQSDPAADAVLIRRTRLLALDIRLLGVDAPGIERHLQRRGVHPALAYESAQWAWSTAEDEAVRPTAQSVPYPANSSSSVRTPKPVPPLVR